MKAIQINSVVNLNNGLQIPSGTVCVISEGLAQVFQTKDGFIPSQIVSQVYTSKANYESGKAAVDGNSITDFDPAMYGLQLEVINYETETAENLLVNAVLAALTAIYPDKCEVVTVTPFVPVIEPVTQ